MQSSREGLSLGAAAETDVGPLAIGLDAQFGTADAEPRGTLALRTDGVRAIYHASVYRRLESMSPGAQALSLAASAATLLFGYDEADYYQATGASLAGAPPLSATQWYAWRLFAQREVPVSTEADSSVAGWLGEDRGLRPNAAAAVATQYGAEVVLRRWWGRDPAGFRWGGEARLESATGDYPHVESSLLLRATVPLPGPLVGGIEAEAGGVWGDAAFQHLRRVGGARSVRGYTGSTLVGESAWRVQAELGTRMPGARLILFSDAGWAGPFHDFGSGTPLLSAGPGLSALDGLIRIDLARALEPPTGWRVPIYLNGRL